MEESSSDRGESKQRGLEWGLCLGSLRDKEEANRAGGEGIFREQDFMPCLFSLTWSGSPDFFVLVLSGLIWFLVALFWDTCQDRPLTFLIADPDSSFAGLQASHSNLTS